MLRSQEYVGVLIAAARRGMQQAVKDRARPYHLSPPQFWALLTLREQPGACFGDLSRRMRIDAPRASRLIAELSRRRLVSMEGDPRDRRRSRIELTAEGRALAAELQPIASSLRNGLLDGLSAQARDALREGLLTVIGNLEKFEKTQKRAPSPRKRGTA